MVLFLGELNMILFKIEKTCWNFIWLICIYELVNLSVLVCMHQYKEKVQKCRSFC